MPSSNRCWCGSRIKRGAGTCHLHARDDGFVPLTQSQIDAWAKGVISSNPQVAAAASTIAPVLLHLSEGDS